MSPKLAPSGPERQRSFDPLLTDAAKGWQQNQERKRCQVVHVNEVEASEGSDVKPGIQVDPEQLAEANGQHPIRPHQRDESEGERHTSEVRSEIAESKEKSFRPDW